MVVYLKEHEHAREDFLPASHFIKVTGRVRKEAATHPRELTPLSLKHALTRLLVDRALQASTSWNFYSHKHPGPCLLHPWPQVLLETALQKVCYLSSSQCPSYCTADGPSTFSEDDSISSIHFCWRRLRRPLPAEDGLHKKTGHVQGLLLPVHLPVKQGCPSGGVHVSGDGGIPGSLSEVLRQERDSTFGLLRQRLQLCWSQGRTSSHTEDASTF